MPLIRKNYRDLTDKQRKEGARLARSRVEGALAVPGLTPLQIQQLQHELNRIAVWESGGVDSSGSHAVAQAEKGQRVTRQDAVEHLKRHLKKKNQ